VPEFIPMDATSVYLDGNGFQTDALINDEFIGRKHLTALYLNGSSIAVVSNQTFKGLTELLVLHLGDNGLTSLDDGQEFDELVSLRELYLHNNALEFIHEDTLKPLMPTLQILTLHGNRLKVDFHVWEYMGPRLRSLSLGANDWSCQCDFVQKFQMALKASPAGLTVVDADDIKCFKEETNSSSCADVLAVSFRSGGDSLWSSWDSLVPVVAVTVASMIIVISLIILAVAARKPLNSW
jgi:Leucine-rich repeat (LRR) protein